MAKTIYRTSPAELEGMPPGVPHIIGNEAAERFSFYGMKAVLAIFMVNYLHLMDGPSGAGMSDAEATEQVHLFTFAVYLTPFLGAVLSDAFLGKYRTIILLSLVYCAGHAALACMGWMGSSPVWLVAGLAMIALGSGGIKPCVSAHVGDQFGARNAHLLSKVFNGFYFSINLGAFASTLLTPWLLEWYGPHWAFGVPGVLMALATLLFWMGRKRFIHVPAKGWNVFISEVTGSGLKVILKLIPLYLFVAMFWALFDQTASRFIFQAQDMDLQFLGVEWLPSQVQAMNPVFILIFIPLFAFLGYPMLDRLWKLTPLRKIGIGLFLMALSFAMASVVQTWIDGGARPNIGWQIGVIALLTAAEVMVSIVALEFAYTQAPKTMKSLMMCFYLGSVAMGNLFVAGVNHFIQIPSAAQQQWEQIEEKRGEQELARLEEVVLPGYDGKTGTEDDILQKLEDGRRGEIEIPGSETFGIAVERIEQMVEEGNGELPAAERLGKYGALSDLRDPWGNKIHYSILNSRSARLISAGPDRERGTPWDLGLVLTLPKEEPPKMETWSDRFHPEDPWLERWKREIGATDEATEDEEDFLLSREAFCGGQSKLLGDSFFWFFTLMMLVTAFAFVPYAILYKPRTYLQD
ncbi:MAG: POT family MFS transporter [Akkermansiaceae bacterium]|nr:POT family MFS transporter [Akkermansiaceae bacterium]